MSCFVMSPDSLGSIAKSLCAVLNGSYNAYGFNAPGSLYETLKDCNISGLYDDQKVYERLYRLNVTAFTGRYAHHGEEELAAEYDYWTMPKTAQNLLTIPEYRGIFNFAPNHWKLLKSLDCLNYQTAEDRTVSDPLRLALVETANALAGVLARNRMEYDAATWG